MGHVLDQWTKPGPPSDKGKPTRIRTDRWGHGKRWLARWTEPDGRETSRAFASKDEAETHLSDVNVRIRGGTYVGDTRVTFRTYAQTWLLSQVHQEPGTADTAGRRLRLDAFPAFGAKPLPKVTRGDVQAMVAGLVERRMAASTVRLSFTYTRAVFNAAVSDRLISVSPCRGVRLPKLDRRLVVPLTEAQVLQLRDQVPKHLARAVMLAAGTGLRPGEWRSLTVDRVLPGRVRVDRQLRPATTAARVVWGPLKTDASYRTVSLSPSIEKVLLEQIEQFPRGPDGLVFTSTRGAPLRRSQLQYAWSVAEAGMGLPDGAGWHELRHHHASLLIASGSSPRAVADRLGHADPAETLRTYSHLWPSDEARILEAVEDAYGDALT